MTFTFDDIPDLTGKVSLVTGGNAGIGEICSQELAKRGSQVFILTRSKERYEQAYQAFNKADPTAAARWSFVSCNLADVESVKQAAETVSSKATRLDIVLNNAGIMAAPYELTPQGLELQVGTNVVGHALLSYMLLPLAISTARSTSSSGTSVRMVQLSSIAHQKFGNGLSPANWESLERVNESFGKGAGATWKRYGKSKTGNILLANELRKATEGENISHLSVHPGVINTGLYKGLDQSYGWLGSVARRILTFTMITPAKGSISSLYAATSPEIDSKKLNGTYFDPQAVVGTKSDWAEDKEGKAGKTMIEFIANFCKEKVGVDIEELKTKALQQ